MGAVRRDAQAYELYGLHVTGIEDSNLPPASGEFRPRMDVRVTHVGAEVACIGGNEAVLDLPEGRQVLLDRGETSATFTGPPLSHDELIHPYLGEAASVFSRWAGREVFHAGAFVTDGLAWAVVGGRGSGKSSLLAELDGRGLAILADDLVITDGFQAFCGPRVIDLRSRRPGTTVPMTPARGASRWRLALPPALAAVPLGGWIYLSWRSEVAMPILPLSVQLERLAARRSWQTLQSDPETLLALSALPGWDLRRPADWDHADETVDLVMETIAAQPLAHSRSTVSRRPAWAQSSRKSATSRAAASELIP